MNEEAKRYVRDVSEKMYAIEAKAIKEGRKMTGEEEAIVAELEGALRAYLNEPEEKLTVPKNMDLGGTHITGSNEGQPHSCQGTPIFPRLGDTNSYDSFPSVDAPPQGSVPWGYCFNALSRFRSL